MEEDEKHEKMGEGEGGRFEIQGGKAADDDPQPFGLGLGFQTLF